MQSVLGTPDSLLAARAIGLDCPFLARWRALTDTIFRARLSELRVSANGQLLGDVAEWLGFVVGVLLTMKGVVDGTVAPSAAIVFLTSYKQLASALTTLSSTVQEMQDESTYLPVLEQYFAIPTEPPGGRPVPPPPLQLELRDVWFRYPNAEQDTLRGLTLTFREGERLALAGVNGAGKTTLLKLLMGVYRPTSGEVLVNGTPLHELDQEAWRATLAIMTQHDPEYSDTLETQVLDGDLAADRDPARFADALSLSGLDAVAAEFPRGSPPTLARSTRCPRTTRSSSRAARSSSSPSPAPTTAPRGCTCSTSRRARWTPRRRTRSSPGCRRRWPGARLFVSHRFSTLRRAERIIVLEHGRVIEDGTDDWCWMAEAGRYAELFQLQARQYASGPVELYSRFTLNTNGTRPPRSPARAAAGTPAPSPRR